MAHVAITNEGGLVSSDLLERIAATPESVEGQRPGDFGVEGRLSEEIQSAFSDAASYWNAFQARLHRGKESATTITRETWMLPLLEEVGYDLRFQRAALQAGGNTYPISHRRGSDENAPPIHIVASDQELDKRGEAKQSPHAIVQDFLNRSDTLWGIVTNGRRLRVLRDTARFSKPSYIEFDLEGMMQGGLYSEFVLFYRLVHSSRLPRTAGDAHDCLLERYHQQGIEEGGRVREKLRDGVKEALEILGTGLVAQSASTTLREKFTAKRLADIEYYRQLLRLIYRLLFLMVAEERRLLFVSSREESARQEIYSRWYSIARLRERADARLFDDGESDLWEGLKQTFRLFEDAKTASALGLTALDGELFGRFACADLIDAKDVPGPRLKNADLLSAIWRLSTFEDSDGKKKRGPRRRVNFAGLDVEELGSVYEALLDYHPQVTIEGERSRFELIAGSERKTTGSYYTPPELVRELIKSALEPVITDRLAKAETSNEKERALLSMKICDPASGSGHFMLAAARRVGRELAKVRSGEAEPNPEDYRRAVRDVICRCIYAVDKNQLAVDLCKVALWIEGHASGLPLSFLDNHVKCGDSLIGVLDFGVLRVGVPDGAYKAMNGDEKKIASEIRKRNRAEAKEASLFHYDVGGETSKLAGAFAAVADLPETSPDEVHAKETRYAELRRGGEWERGKTACDLWTTAFFAPLTMEGNVAIPTTRHVWEAVAGQLPTGRVSGLAAVLSRDQRFFHWPLEFPEVFAGGESGAGFDVTLGNPPWEVAQLKEEEFFWSKDPEIARLKGGRRKAAIARLAAEKQSLWDELVSAQRISDKQTEFWRECGRFPATTVGKLNTYALFTEASFHLIRKIGYMGMIVQSDILTSTTYSNFVERIISDNLLVSFYDFENVERLFPEMDTRNPHFSLLTIAGESSERLADVAFWTTNPKQLTDTRRHFDLTRASLSELSPGVFALPMIRSRSDAEITRRIFHREAIKDGTGVNNLRSFQFEYRQGIFNSTADNRFLKDFHTVPRNADAITFGDTKWLPAFEPKSFHQFDSRFADWDPVRGKIAPVSTEAKGDPHFALRPAYWMEENEVISRISGRSYKMDFIIAVRRITNSTNERTVIASLVESPCFNENTWLFFMQEEPARCLLFLANLNSMIFDYLVRQRMSSAFVPISTLERIPFLMPGRYSPKDQGVIAENVIELSYTFHGFSTRATAAGFQREPHEWNTDRRSRLRAELDAYYAYLYGLTRRELEYILDPKAVMGEDYPSETFRVLKDNEIRQFGEYRTQRLVLAAWDRFVGDGTFDLARLRDPQYIDRVSDELSRTRARLEETERNQRALAMLAAETPRPTLFLEGITDVTIIEAAWSVFFPGEPIPVKVLAAGGTKEMGSLAGPGKALREVLGDRQVLALADNDAAGRKLIDDGHIKKGGIFKQLSNGIHWCLLKPTEGFAAVMKAHAIPAAYWPFTIEAAFLPSLRRVAEAAGAWAFSGPYRLSFSTIPIWPVAWSRCCRDSAQETTPIGI